MSAASAAGFIRWHRQLCITTEYSYPNRLKRLTKESEQSTKPQC